jgi:hypothetical protein
MKNKSIRMLSIIIWQYSKQLQGTGYFDPTKNNQLEYFSLMTFIIP